MEFSRRNTVTVGNKQAIGIVLALVVLAAKLIFGIDVPVLPGV